MIITLTYITFISLARVGTQLIQAIFTEAVRVAVSEWRANVTYEQVLEYLARPGDLGRELQPAIERELNSRGEQLCRGASLCMGTALPDAGGYLPAR